MTTCQTTCLTALFLLATACGNEDSSTASETDATTAGPTTSESETTTDATTTETTVDTNESETDETTDATTDDVTTDDATTDDATTDDTTTDDPSDTDMTVGTDSETEGAELEIVGAYSDNYGGSHDIANDAWTQEFDGATLSFEILSYDNAADYLVAQNADSNEFNPSLFSKFEWTMVDDSLWYCQTAFGAETAEDAENTAPADNSDLEGAGCGGFAWTELYPE